MGGELIGALILLVLILCVRSAINDSYAEKQREIQKIQQAQKEDYQKQIKIITAFRQEVLLGKWVAPSHYTVHYKQEREETKNECRKRLRQAGCIPNETYINIFLF